MIHWILLSACSPLLCAATPVVSDGEVDVVFGAVLGVGGVVTDAGAVEGT